MQLIHRSYTRKTNSKPPANKTSDSAKHVCNFKNCGRKFTSYHKLYQHRKSQGHQQKKRSHSPQKEKNAVKAKKFRSNLMDYLSRRSEVKSEINPDETASENVKQSDAISADSSDESGNESSRGNISSSTHANEENHAEEDEMVTDDELCNSGHCIVDELPDKVRKIKWVLCEKCESWYHTICVGISDSVDIETDNYKYICKTCLK